MEHITKQPSPEVLAAQRAYKTSKEQFRKAIRELADNQRLMKANRKTLYFEGERVMTAISAAVTHAINRKELRHLHLAYTLTRAEYGGYKKNFKVNMDGINSKYIDKLIKQYAPKTVHLNP